jgi:hypothetical protein
MCVVCEWQRMLATSGLPEAWQSGGMHHASPYHKTHAHFMLCACTFHAGNVAIAEMQWQVFVMACRMCSLSVTGQGGVRARGGEDNVVWRVHWQCQWRPPCCVTQLVCAGR